jgi:alkylation response protein AidB-like acyl-CoA dehydrogenase
VGPAVVTQEQLERWIVPTIRGERHECYAITEEGAGPTSTRSRRRPVGTATPTCSTATKMHVTLVQLGRLPVRTGQDRRRAERRFARDVLRRQGHPGVRLVREPRYTHTYADTHAIVAFEDVRVPVSNLIGQEGTAWRSPTSGSGTSG